MNQKYFPQRYIVKLAQFMKIGKTVFSNQFAFSTRYPITLAPQGGSQLEVKNGITELSGFSLSGLSLHTKRINQSNITCYDNIKRCIAS